MGNEPVKINRLLNGLKQSIKNIRIKDTEESGMIWTGIMV